MAGPRKPVALHLISPAHEADVARPVACLGNYLVNKSKNPPQPFASQGSRSERVGFEPKCSELLQRFRQKIPFYDEKTPPAVLPKKLERFSSPSPGGLHPRSSKKAEVVRHKLPRSRGNASNGHQGASVEKAG
jgi:hypothetical protein